jgi:myo-inositol 2-dehydrogenase/D-chiro-inositol 1-dehydrogenase
MNDQSASPSQAVDQSRRQFIRTSGVAVGGILAAPLVLGTKSSAASGDILKIGLIGCGGRGTGAAGQALNADPNVVLTAVGDAFENATKISLAALRHDEGLAGKVKVDPDHIFVGLDAYQKVLASGVDVVILATPPGFRPIHLKAAIEAGKHIFCEKPVATDAPGIRSVLESVALAKQKKLALVAGFCWRYSVPERALFERVLNGDIGEVRAIYGTYYTSPVKPHPPANQRAAGMTDLEWQVRNWYNYVWLSGDSLVEQAIHAVDWMCWAMKDVPPLKAVAVGGRQIPSPGGNIFDHFEVNYEYANGARGFLGCRQQTNCWSNNTATIFGTAGEAYEMGFAGAPHIKGPKEWSFSGSRHKDMYQIEHDALFASIRRGEPINDGLRLAHSTMAGIMGRMAAYTGKEITWEMAMNSKENLAPDSFASAPASSSWDVPVKTPPLAMPGFTRFS